MHKRNIALAAAMLLFNDAAMAQAGQSQQDTRAHRAMDTANNRRSEGASGAAPQKQD